MTYLRRLLLLFLTLALAIALTACQPARLVKTDVAQVTQLVIAAQSDPNTFNAALNR